MTVNDTKMISVRNLADHVVGFLDEDTHRRIIFQPGEIKKIDAGMLRRLNYSRGGNVLLTDFLAVENQELAEEFGVSEDSFNHEYSWTQNDVDRVLQEGTLDELKDALDFAPEGVIQMIIERSVEIELNDVVKRQTIQDMTGADITSKIKNKKALENTVNAPAAQNQRRVKDSSEKEENSGRRTS